MTKIIDPKAIEYIIDVILFLILWACKFLETIYFIDAFSKNKSTYVRNSSRNLYKLKASNESPRSIPIRMAKKILRTRARLNDSIASGRK